MNLNDTHANGTDDNIAETAVNSSGLVPNGQSKSTAPDAQGESATVGEIRCTLYMNDGKKPLSKKLTLTEDGKLNKEPSPPLATGTYHTLSINSLERFVEVVADRATLGPHWVCSSSVGPAEKGLITTEKAIKAGKAAPYAIARSKESFKLRAAPSIMLIDVDLRDGVYLTPEEIDAIFSRIVPWWGGVKHVYLPSNTCNIYRKSDGKRVSTKSGWHIYIVVDDGTKIPALGDEIFIWLVEAGLGTYRILDDGTRQLMTLIDRAVYKPNSLDYAFGPHIPAGQDLEQRSKPTWFNGAPMLATAGLGRTDLKEWQVASEKAQKILNAPEVIKESNAKRQVWGEKQKARVISYPKKAGIDPSRAVDAFNRSLALDDDGIYTLYGGFPLQGPDGAFTVDDAFDSPEKYHGQAIDNPMEPGTGRGKTKIYLVGQRSGPMIHCFAHGGATYRLRRDTGQF